jgi:hypothetical protein
LGRIKSFLFLILAFFAVLFGAVLYWHNSPFFLKGPEHGFLLTKSDAVRYSVYLPAFYIHIITGSIVLVTGIFQFSRNIRFRYAALHRSAGKVYIAVVLLLTAPSGFVMSLFANGGLPAQTGFAILASLWWLFTWKAWQSAIGRDWTRHREFMLRSYALTFAAVTLRMYSFVFALIGFRGEFIYNVIVWLSWVPSLIIVEVWVRYSARKTEAVKL